MTDDENFKKNYDTSLHLLEEEIQEREMRVIQNSKANQFFLMYIS